MIGLHDPSFNEVDENQVLQALRSSWVSTGGPQVVEFENAFSELTGAMHTVSVCNGTIGLQLCFYALAKQRHYTNGFEVIIPTLTFIATANAVIHSGGIPVLVDSEPTDMHMSPMHLKHLIEDRYREEGSLLISKITGLPLLAVVPVHLMGWGARMEVISEICDRFNVPLIEDSAEAVGVRWAPSNKHIGLHGIASVFSFNGNKILTTGGGGMIISNNAEFAKLLKHLSTTAKTDSYNYIHDEIGFNFRMINLLAALGCSQIQKLHDYMLRKKEIFHRYLDLHRLCDCRVYVQNNVESNYWLTNLIFKDRFVREFVAKKLTENNIQVRPLWTPIHLQPAYREICQKESFHNATAFWDRILSIPSGPMMTEVQIDFVKEVVVQATNEAVLHH